MTSIGATAFYKCSDLTSLKISEKVTNIGKEAFSGCDRLTIYCEAASQPSGWNSNWNPSCPVVWDCNNNDIADDGYIYAAIDGICYRMKDVEAIVLQQPHDIQTANIPASITYKDNTYAVTSIADKAFYECSSLTSVVIGDSVTSIGQYAFYKCDNLINLVIGNSVTSIGNSAFMNCYGLTSVVISDNVTSIEEYAFVGCNSLTEIYYYGTESAWKKIDIGSRNDELTSATRYYYSEEDPTEEGNYWYYVDGVVTKW